MSVFKVAMGIGLLAVGGAVAYQLSKNGGLCRGDVADDSDADEAEELLELDEMVVMD